MKLVYVFLFFIQLLLLIILMLTFFQIFTGESFPTMYEKAVAVCIVVPFIYGVAIWMKSTINNIKG